MTKLAIGKSSNNLILMENKSSITWKVSIITRLSKLVLIAAVAVFLSLTVFNNIIDYKTNFQFIKNIVSMNSVFLSHQNSWRSITIPILHHWLYWTIIGWELFVALLCVGGIYQMGMALKAPAKLFHQTKALAISGLTANLLTWMVAFIIGNQWFLMWQSELWNSQDTVFQMSTIGAMILIFVSLPEDSS